MESKTWSNWWWCPCFYNFQMSVKRKKAQHKLKMTECHFLITVLSIRLTVLLYSVSPLKIVSLWQKGYHAYRCSYLPCCSQSASGGICRPRIACSSERHGWMDNWPPENANTPSMLSKLLLPCHKRLTLVKLYMARLLRSSNNSNVKHCLLNGDYR